MEEKTIYLSCNSNEDKDIALLHKIQSEIIDKYGDEVKVEVKNKFNKEK